MIRNSSIWKHKSTSKLHKISSRSFTIGQWKDSWDDIKNQRIFFDNLKNSLKIRKEEDWFTVDVKKVLENGGSFVALKYNNSLIEGKEIT
jgi:hypothetical protein